MLRISICKDNHLYLYRVKKCENRTFFISSARYGVLNQENKIVYQNTKIYRLLHILWQSSRAFFHFVTGVLGKKHSTPACQTHIVDIPLHNIITKLPYINNTAFNLKNGIFSGAKTLPAPQTARKNGCQIISAWLPSMVSFPPKGKTLFNRLGKIPREENPFTSRGR